VSWLRPYRKVRLEIVKRTFGWFYKYRRLSKDDEYLTATSEAMMYMAMIHIMVGRIALKTPF
jgi:putative transposase